MKAWEIHDLELIDGTKLRAREVIEIPIEEVFPGLKPAGTLPDGAPALRVTKIDYETKTVTLEGYVAPAPPET